MPEQTLADQAEATGKQFQTEISDVKETRSPKAVEELRIAYLGRKGKVSGLLEGLRTCSKDERPVAGKSINLLKQEIEKSIASLREEANIWIIDEKLNQDPIDISLPIETKPAGALHPVTLMRQRLIEEFHRLGFTIYDGPEVDFDFYNFNALNIPDYHPARDMQDTFYLSGDHKDLLLRTHTSNIQIHCMLNEKPPLRIAALGRVFRCDSDPTHTPMFHQIEAFVVDKGISFAHLKGVIDTFMKAIFGQDMKTRFRPSYFPFVEPGAEMDLQCVMCKGKGCRLCKETGWIEIGGCGMIHPNVFEAVDYDSDIYTGFAFGFGIDRMAMLKYSLPDLRQLFEGDYTFLNQFPVLK